MCYGDFSRLGHDPGDECDCKPLEDFERRYEEKVALGFLARLTDNDIKFLRCLRIDPEKETVAEDFD